MAQRKVLFAIDEYYHIFNRGVDKRVIFKDKEDYQHFLYLMYICNTQKSIVLRDIGKHFERGESIINIGAYCLMPNHFHILVRERQEGGISLYMLKLLTGYSMYFNKKYSRTGTLFEGTFKSSHCDEDRYLKYLYSYIHLNPAKLIDKKWKEKKERNINQLFDYIKNYRYSSISEYLSEKNYIINAKVFPRYFSNLHSKKSEMFSWLEFTT